MQTSCVHSHQLGADLSPVPSASAAQTLPEQITIDGAVYIRGGTVASAPPYGVAITTHNRADVAKRCVENVLTNSKGAYVVVVDDASTEPFTAPGVTVFRSEEQLGIARAKNKCIELLMDAGVEHLFLLDDDCWPTEPYWMERYAEHPEPHLCYLFKDKNGRGQVLPTPRTTYDDGTMWAQDHPRGCLLYLHRSVIDRVGGYRPEFGIWGNEHVEYSRRIFNAGLTLQPYQDVSGSNQFIYSLDERPADVPNFKRSVPERVRNAELQRNDVTLAQFIDSTDFVDYRDRPNVVMTALLTTNIDPQRHKKWSADPGVLDAWKNSIAGAETIVLHDELDNQTAGFVKVPSGHVAYVQRWCAYYQYLRANPCRWVFCTDGSDVVMLREPWSELEPGKLYVGWEPTVLGIPWMTERHPEHRDWIQANASRMLLNAGIVGGDHATVLEFCRDLAADLLASESVFDMGSFNKIAYSQKWIDRLMTGPKVATLFKHKESNQWSWFQHK